MKSFAFVLLFLNFSGTIINARFYTRQYVDRLSIENDRFNGDADNRNFENAPFDELLYATSKHAKEDKQWNENVAIELNKLVGQISGLATFSNLLYVFHRANITWDERFYLPHGISVDLVGNLWLTDVALHQVFRYRNDNLEQPDLILGERFVPGNDAGHFCQPTDVAISSTGTAYISDGYCNSRVVVFAANGRYLSEFGDKENMVIPHSLALLESEDLICVADRENNRVLCYSAGLMSSKTRDIMQRSRGQLMMELSLKQLKKVYAISSLGDIIFALNGGKVPTVGVSIDLGTEQIVDVWTPENDSFYDAHDLAVSPDTNSFYVCQLSLSKKKILKFHLSEYPVLLPN
ncbi:NHL repeat protein [Sarcoptes scabiei]|uniref:NHL repeat protein n=1 Tax=Sarcoptes scabiei TaxID=52283 RepID=A0A132A556_SARSC|nr:NHL repeat protein [Sarcoptes scabiei]